MFVQNVTRTNWWSYLILRLEHIELDGSEYGIAFRTHAACSPTVQCMYTYIIQCIIQLQSGV